MSTLTISLLGTIQLHHGQQPLRGTAYAKVLGLLAYLAAESGRPHPRSTLAALLWPDQPDERARHSLRQALSTLRRLLDDGLPHQPLLTQRDTVQLNPAAGIEVDVQVLNDLLDACDRHQHARLDRCPACAQRIAQAVALMRGEFLAGFSIDDSPDFDDWVVVWRERIQRRVMPALTALVAWHRHRGALDEAAAALGTQLELDPWLEEAHRDLMEVLWHQGNRAGAIAQYERCRQLLEDELGIEPDPATTELYERIVTMTQPPSARTGLDAQASWLPTPPGRLVGRQRERADIADLLARHDCHLLTLVGPGGVGKTRLAIQVAQDSRNHGFGDIWFVSLESIRQPAAIVRTIAARLGLALPATGNPLPELQAWLRDRTALLVLDNVEHLVDGMGIVSEVLDAAPGLTLLVTSRERLQLRGEWVYELQGLPVASPAHDDERSDAIELFEDCLHRVRPRLALQPDELSVAAEICQLVEGLPLAIELAVAWAQALAVEEIARNIRHSVDFLATTLRDVPARHRGMRIVFSQTWQLLSPAEQAAYRRLGIFRQGFTLAAAEEVTGASALQLSTFVSKSMVMQGPPGRFRLHNLLAQYARERLEAEDDDIATLEHGHATYYLGWLAEQEQPLTGHDQRSALAAIEEDFGNIHAAWMWAVHERDVQLLQPAMHPMWLYLVIRGLMRDGASVFHSVVDALDAAGDSEAAGRPAWVLARATAMARAGGFESGLGRFEEGIELLDDALPVLQAHGVTREVGLCLNMLAAAHAMTGDLETATTHLEESLVAFRAVGDRWGIAYSLNDLGLMLHLRGTSEVAEKHCEQSWAMLRQMGDRRGAAFATYNLGTIASHRGEHARAQQLFHESLALREAGGDQWGIGMSLIRLAAETRLLGDGDAARAHYLSALRISWNSSVWPLVLEALVGLASFLLDAGRAEEADAILAPVAKHPSTPGSLSVRIEELRPDLDGWSGWPQPGLPADAWATEAVSGIARALATSPDHLLPS
jgi:predicted ATPase/DNA-binding SARP family transcriptional activator